MNPADEKKKRTGGPRRIFLPQARVLDRNELGTLSDKERAFESECKSRGIWLELFCPDDACFVEGDRIKLPVFCENPEHKHSLWLDIFCPDGSCDVTDASKLP